MPTPSNPVQKTVAPTPTNFWDGLRREMDELFDRFSGGPSRLLPVERAPMFWPYPRSFGFGQPAADFTEDAETFRITAELPGLTLKDIDLSLTGRALVLRGEKHDERQETGETYRLAERNFGSFERTFYLPETVDQDKIGAKFENGVLTVTLPKTADAVTKQKKIEIQEH
jgi:HSP20 family protein